ncbi:MAG: hypothetical protein ACYDIA_09585 [Candidatus Humimicrobiaceae bacterium]
MTYALLNIEAIKKQALRKPLEALENKDRTNTTPYEDIETLKAIYNWLPHRFNKAEEYLSNDKIGLEIREQWIPKFKEILFKMEEILTKINHKTKEEILEGFKL